MMSQKHEKVCTTLNYIKYLVILISAVTCRVSISAFASLVCFSVGIASSEVELKVGGVT